MKSPKSRNGQTSSTTKSSNCERTVEIYVRDRFYGRIKMAFPKEPFSRDEEDIHKEILQRMPSLKNEDFTISF